MSTFPRTLTDLKAGDDPLLSSSKFYGSLKELRRSTLSIQNRLRSVLEDAEFVQKVAVEFKLPVVANERCGSWYISPESKVGSAYFKSTDGHAGQWNFSLRRLNLQVLDTVGQHGGCIIVDSTRRGKIMPDAFSKTLPIWCAVMNRALLPELQQFHRLQLPAVGLPVSEIAQIEDRLEDFVRAFQGLGLDLEALRQRLARPIRLHWVVEHSVTALPAPETHVGGLDTPCHNIILCSASRRVKGAEMSDGGYIQGAGDDSEGWSQGMTPRVFWKHQDMLFRTQEDKLPELIKKLVLGEEKLSKSDQAVLIEPTKNLYIGSRATHESQPDFDLVISCHSRQADAQNTSRHLNLECDFGKLGSRDLRQKLHKVKASAARTLEQNAASRILITCENGNDLSVGVGLMMLCLFYTSDGRCLGKYNHHIVSLVSRSTSRPLSHQEGEKIDKAFIRQRLAWVISSKPDANPSRSTLQSINAYLMERP